MPPISVLIKPSSGMCNMKCDYCFYCDEMKKRMRESYGFMTEQTLKNVMRIKVVNRLYVELRFTKKRWNIKDITISAEYV